MHEEESKTPAYKYDPKGFWTVFEEIKSPLINKFFPNHRIFREQLVGAQVLGAFALGKDGTITDIDDGWSGKPSTKKFTNPKYSDFLKSQNIKINNAPDAARLIQLTELIEINWSLKGYKYTASREDSYWRGYGSYIGTPWTRFLECFLPRGSMGRIPTKWIIGVDKQNLVNEIFQEALAW